MNKNYHLHLRGIGSERADGRNKQNHLMAGWLFFTTFYALVSLVMVTGGQHDLTSTLVAEIGVRVIFWLFLTFGEGMALYYLIHRWFGAPTESLEPPEPDRLTQYLALKQRLHGQYGAESWWDPATQEFCYDFRHVELEISRPFHEKVMAWAQARDISFSQAAEALLTRGLADDHLDRITIHSGWAEWPKAEGGPPWI